MSPPVPRTVTEIGEHGSPVKRQPASENDFDWGDVLTGDDSTDWAEVLAGRDPGARPGDSLTLEDFRECDAYVLLGAPGAGKTTLFESEGGREGCHCVTARRFVALGIEQLPPDWRDTTLFIDGLDEKRAGSVDGRTPLDDIWARLEALGRPRFRLSCREADWFGSSDRSHLETASKNGKVKVLRLDPLNAACIRELLNRRPDVQDADEFIYEARKRRIEHLLTNPKNLEMLAKAVSGGAWPETRMRTFELACEKLAGEFNREHQIATPDRPSKPELLAAAGKLWAIQLLTGHAGYVEVGGGDDSGIPGLESIPGDERATLRLALRTRLFESSNEEGSVVEGRRIQDHRQVSEFLAARYLANLIDDGHPVRRVLALMTGEDGGVVSELRGLAAWLAAHCLRARQELIERDPEGVAAYGDAAVFTHDEKRRLLKCLSPVDPTLDASLFTFLATPDMAPVLRELLADSNRCQAHQDLVLFLLCVLANAPPLPGLGEVLLDLAVSDGRSSNSRQWAAICLAEGTLERPMEFGSLVRGLLHGLRETSVRDEGKNILGNLLRYLYPTFIGPDEVFDYFDEDHERHRYIGDRLGSYDMFWRHDLARESRPQDLAMLLDELERVFERFEDWRLMEEPPATPLARTAGVLVKRGLLECDGVDPRRTLRWLRLAGGDGGGNAQIAEAIRNWVEERPERYKKLLCYGVAGCPPSDAFSGGKRTAKRALHGARVPCDYGRWCLAQIDQVERDETLSKFWFEEAWFALIVGNGADGLTLEHLEHAAAKNAVLARLFDDFRSTDINSPIANLAREARKRESERLRESEPAFAAWRGSILRHEKALRENRCPAGPLNTIAEAYLGHYLDVGGEVGHERLREFLGADTLVEAAMDGLRGAILRDDLPSAEEVLALRTENQRHLLAFPVVAGLGLISVDSVITLDNSRARVAIALYLASQPPSPEPAWVRLLFESRPNVAADEIVRFASKAMRRGERHLSFVYEMLDNESLNEVARSACPRLLRAFPVRAPQHLNIVLNRLLWWGVVNLDSLMLEPIVAGKLAAKSMMRTRRGYWTAAHLALAPKNGLEEIGDFADKQENALEGFFAFYGRSPFQERLIKQLPSSLAGQLARLLHVGRRTLGEIRPIPAGSRESELVRTLIEALGAQVDDDALSALSELANDLRMAAWHPVIERVQQAQRVRRRDAHFQHPDVNAVIRSLERGKPANAADLHALAVATIEELAEEIRNGSADGWKDFWNVDQYERALTPRPENTCRNTLLDRLQVRLRHLGISVVREGSHAMNTHSDIHLLVEDFSVPVEIKRSSHRKLWSAIRNQLIARYTLDPGAGGYGIYLVFWFGNEPTPCQIPESGTRPKSAVELRERLHGSLTPEEARLISVCVIDVSRP